MSYDDRTKEELQEELRRRDLPVSGTKDELIDRLEEDQTDRGDGSRRRRGSRASPGDIARRAALQLGELRGLEVEGVTGFQRTDGGWRVLVEVVEVSRVPTSTDVLGAYEVELDDEGELVGFERLRRYVRGRAGEDQA